VTHGTREKSATKKLLHSDVSGQGLGTLIPDAILLSGTTIRGVVDAKYKSLHPSASSPNGPQRDDLYQMAAYLGRFQAPAGLLTWGFLAYPFDPSKPDTPLAEQNSPWSLDGGKKIGFISLPHNPVDAVMKLRHFLTQVARTNSQLATA
jgi:5-methylcytosine-specific restriction enzyme subunit McrC